MIQQADGGSLLHLEEVSPEELPGRADLRPSELPFRQVSTAEITDTGCLLTDHRVWRQETEGHAPNSVLPRWNQGRSCVLEIGNFGILGFFLLCFCLFMEFWAQLLTPWYVFLKRRCWWRSQNRQLPHSTGSTYPAHTPTALLCLWPYLWFILPGFILWLWN